MRRIVIALALVLGIASGLFADYIMIVKNPYPSKLAQAFNHKGYDFYIEASVKVSGDYWYAIIFRGDPPASIGGIVSRLNSCIGAPDSAVYDVGDDPDNEYIQLIRSE